MRIKTLVFCILFLNACASTSQNSKIDSTSSITHKVYRVAAAQFLIQTSQKLAVFFGKVETLVQQAAQQKVDLVVFPELLVMDLWQVGSQVSEGVMARQMAVELTPKYFAEIGRLSAKYGLAILAGSAPRVVGGKIFNTALLVFPNGRKIYQDKIFLTQWEKAQGWSPGKEVRVFDAPWGRSVILICFDSEFPLLSQLLAAQQPEWIFIPSMTESEAGLNRVRWSAQARAIEHHAFVVVAGTVGKVADDWVHFGQGALLEPWEGNFRGVVNEGKKNHPGLVLGGFDVESLRASRLASKFFPVKEQKNRPRGATTGVTYEVH